MRRGNWISKLQESHSVSDGYESLKSQLKSSLQEKASQLNISPQKLQWLSPFVDEYLESSKAAGFAVDHCSNSLQVMMKEVIRAMKEPFKFSSYHQAVRSPFDYYTWANEFFRPLIKFERSRLLGVDNAKDIDSLLKRGENVVILSNHQTEVDPQVISLLFETSGDPDLKALAEKMIFLAGHKVTTDPVAIPYSMGRNLICIHSKKHIKNPPEEAQKKQQQNLASMQALGQLFAQGGYCFWVAPSGGRDRPQTNSDGEVPDPSRFVVASFDSKVLDMFRLLAMQSGKGAKTHFFPMAMFTHQLIPPPTSVSSEVGESRSAKRGEVSLHVLPKCPDLGSLKDTKYCENVQKQVAEAYEDLHNWHYHNK